LFLLLLLTGCKNEYLTNRNDVLTGKVVDENGPVALAIVRIQATQNSGLTDKKGQFILSGLNPEQQITVSAWKDGYYCAKVEAVLVPQTGITLVLRKYQTTDNKEYQWMPPIGEESCFSCKPEITEIWLKNAHANSAVNQRFFSMYNGTDLAGNQSPATHYSYDRDYGTRPVPTQEGQKYYGSGYKLDFPDKKGNCAACHTPGAAIENPYGVDPNKVQGADQFGIHCDFCHKVVAVTLNPETKMPYDNMPGVMSMEFRRPFPEDKDRYQLFFGTFDDDNVPEEDTKLPLLEESQFCATCHFGKFWDTIIYNSYGEWLASPYSDPKTGQTCQDCHMPSPTIYQGKELTNVAKGKGGVERDPQTIHAHLQLGATDQQFLQEALSMEVEYQKVNSFIKIKVALYNDNTGHHIPTDSPLRHLILIVQAFDQNQGSLTLRTGPTLPDWCGQGEIAEGAFAGLPGKAYAKILQEIWTKKTPTGAYWNPVKIVSDNRLAAFQKDTSEYLFELPENQKGSIQIELYYRRAFFSLMKQKGWKDPDILLKKEVVILEK
ncbi:MAG: hypothetical protein MJB14_03605, partial [Spirochaetes bacterium]|nr:hypothetical protein [Spirochaetota bacterium]